MKYYKSGNTLIATTGAIDAPEITKEEYEAGMIVLQKAWETKKDFIERSRPLTTEEVIHMVIAGTINTLTVDDNTALRMADFYPEWLADAEYALGNKVQYAGRLWRCRQSHSAQTGWEPENTASLWEQINETHTGTADDPIPYEGGMALSTGLYYVQDYVIYLCTRDTGNPVYHTLEQLIGAYVEQL